MPCAYGAARTIRLRHVDKNAFHFHFSITKDPLLNDYSILKPGLNRQGRQRKDQQSINQ